MNTETEMSMDLEDVFICRSERSLISNKEEIFVEEEWKYDPNTGLYQNVENSE